MVDPGLIKQVHLLPWNLKGLTLGSSFLSICSFTFPRGVYAPWLGVKHKQLTAPRTVSNMYLKRPGCNRVQIMCNTSGAHHMQHVMYSVVQKDSSAQFDNV